MSRTLRTLGLTLSGGLALSLIGLASPAQAADTTPPPKPVVTQPALLDGVNARLYVTGKTAADHTRTQVIRLNYTHISEPLKVFTVASTATAIPVGNLTVGNQYAFDLRSIDSSGNQSLPTRIELSATARPSGAAATYIQNDVQGLSQPYPNRATLHVGAGTGNHPSTTYTTRFSFGGGPVKPWLTDRPAGTYALGAPAATGVAATTRKVGSYHLEQFAKDQFGNRTALVSSDFFLNPYDDVDFTATGNVSRIADPQSRVGGSLLVLDGVGSSVTFKAQGDFFRLWGPRSTDGGDFDVYVNGAFQGWGSSNDYEGSDTGYITAFAHGMGVWRVNTITITPNGVHGDKVYLDYVGIRYTEIGGAYPS